MATFPPYRSYTTRQLRQFAWLIALVIVAFVAYAAYAAYQLDPASLTAEARVTETMTWVGIAAASVGLGVIRPEILRPPFHVWMTVGTVVGLVMNAILLTVFFLVLLTPISLVMRALGRAPIKTRRGRGRSSYWLARDEPSDDHYPRPFGLARTRPADSDPNA